MASSNGPVTAGPAGAAPAKSDSPARETYVKEQAIRDKLAELTAERMKSNPFEVASNGEPQSVPVELPLGLACVALMLDHGMLSEEEIHRLAGRVNVLLRAHRPMALPLQVSDV